MGLNEIFFCVCMCIFMWCKDVISFRFAHFCVFVCVWLTFYCKKWNEREREKVNLFHELENFRMTEWMDKKLTFQFIFWSFNSIQFIEPFKYFFCVCVSHKWWSYHRYRYNSFLLVQLFNWKYTLIHTPFLYPICVSYFV